MKTPVLFLAMIATMGAAIAKPYDVAEKSFSALQADLSAGRVTSEELVRSYVARIDAIDRNGPRLRSVPYQMSVWARCAASNCPGQSSVAPGSPTSFFFYETTVCYAPPPCLRQRP